MKLRTVFIADTRSLYFGVKNKFAGHSLNYLDLLKQLEEKHNLLFTFKFAFGKYEPDKCHKFNTLLRETGFQVYFERRHYDAELALKAANCLPHIDAVVLASCWYAHFPVLEYAKDNGKLTYLVGVDNPRFVHYYCTPIEIDNTILRKKEDAVAPTSE